MTPAAFRAELVARFATSSSPTGQAEFARFLAARGHPASQAGVARSVRRWAQVGPPGEVIVILALLREQAAAA